MLKKMLLLTVATVSMYAAGVPQAPTTVRRPTTFVPIIATGVAKNSDDNRTATAAQPAAYGATDRTPIQPNITAAKAQELRDSLAAATAEVQTKTQQLTNLTTQHEAILAELNNTKASAQAAQSLLNDLLVTEFTETDVRHAIAIDHGNGLVDIVSGFQSGAGAINATQHANNTARIAELETTLQKLHEPKPQTDAFTQFPDEAIDNTSTPAVVSDASAAIPSAPAPQAKPFSDRKLWSDQAKKQNASAALTTINSAKINGVTFNAMNQLIDDINASAVITNRPTITDPSDKIALLNDLRKYAVSIGISVSDVEKSEPAVLPSLIRAHLKLS